MVKIRRPTQAGTFYEGNAESLRNQIKRCFLHEYGPGKIPKTKGRNQRRIFGLICPHAGYMYSGPVAANAYNELANDGKPDIIIILGPNHRGYGSALSIMTEGFWRTPLGDVEIDSQTATEIVNLSGIVDIDEIAHLNEHSIEVQLPFLQYIYTSEFSFVPICFLLQDLHSAVEVGEALGKVLANKNAVVIASSDLTHYEPQRNAINKDNLALEAIKAMDVQRLYSIIETQHISACGYGPISSLITAMRILGAKEAEVLSYQTSGDIIGDFSGVVGYASVAFKK